MSKDDPSIIDLRMELETSVRNLIDHFTGDDAISSNMALQFRRAIEVFAMKHHDYGRDNISSSGEVGVLVRLQDKVARLKNLHANGGTHHNESAKDTAVDIANYGVILMCLMAGGWPQANGWEIVK